MNHILSMLGALLPLHTFAANAPAVAPLDIAYCQQVAEGASFESASWAADALEERLRGQAINGILISIYNRGLADGTLLVRESPLGPDGVDPSLSSQSPLAPVRLQIAMPATQRILGYVTSPELRVARVGLEIQLDLLFRDPALGLRRYMRRFSYEAFATEFPRNRITLDPLLRGWEPMDGDLIRMDYERTLVDPFYSPGRDRPLPLRVAFPSSDILTLLEGFGVILGYRPHRMARSIFHVGLMAYRLETQPQTLDPIVAGDRLLLPGPEHAWPSVRRILVVKREGDILTGFDEGTREFLRFPETLPLAYAGGNFFVYRLRRAPNSRAVLAERMASMFRAPSANPRELTEWQRIPAAARALPDFAEIVRERIRAGFEHVTTDRLVRAQIEAGRYPDLRFPDRAAQAEIDFIREMGFGDEIYFLDKRQRRWRTLARASGNSQRVHFIELETGWGPTLVDDDLTSVLGSSLSGADFFRTRVEAGTVFLRRRSGEN